MKCRQTREACIAAPCRVVYPMVLMKTRCDALVAQMISAMSSVTRKFWQDLVLCHL